MSDQNDFQFWREYFRQMRAENRDHNTTVLLDVCEGLQIYVERKSDYHFRLTKAGFNGLDVFPTSGKIHQLGGPYPFKRVRHVGEAVAAHFGGL
jgi:hypothetical protein